MASHLVSRCSPSRRSLSTFIVGAKRTPMGSFGGSLSSLPGPKLASLAIQEALGQAGLSKDSVDEVILGSVISSGVGQAPDRQAALFAGLPESVPCTLVNKVCASGMKSIMNGSASLSLGQGNSIAVCGGFESMSNIPFYLPRGTVPYGGTKLLDGLVHDGLTDVYNKFHMGNCGENTAKVHGISREQQDEYAINSYKRSLAAYEAGHIGEEIFSVEVPQRRKPPVIVSEDEEFRKAKFDKFASLPTAFQRENGSVTAGNASTLSDGAAVTILASETAFNEYKDLKPLARILAYADGATKPIDFPIAPVFATEKLLKAAGLSASQVDLWEINEAFSVVVLANMKLLDLDPSKVNIHGGAVSLGHPLGASGARIVNHLVYALQPGQKGIASICNGGGGASSILIEKL